MDHSISSISPDSATQYGIWDFKPFGKLKQQVSYLVEGLIEKYAPFVLCAQLKTMKTRVLVDLAVSLASGGSFLGQYRCEKSKVLFACAEDGEPLIRRNCMLVAESRGMHFDHQSDLHVMARGGRIDESSLRDLAKCMKAYGPGTVLIVDPAKDYFGGLEPTSSILSNCLGQLRDTCRDCESTLVLSCHSTKGAEGLDLQMMQGTAFASAAGGWWLMRRSGSYKFDGIHNLEVKYGGRTGRAGGLSFTINEKMNDSGEPTGYKLEFRLDKPGVQRTDEAIESSIITLLEKESSLTCNAIRRKLHELEIRIAQGSVEKSLKELHRKKKIDSTAAVYNGRVSLRYSVTPSPAASV